MTTSLQAESQIVAEGMLRTSGTSIRTLLCHQLGITRGGTTRIKFVKRSCSEEADEDMEDPSLCFRSRKQKPQIYRPSKTFRQSSVGLLKLNLKSYPKTAYHIETKFFGEIDPWFTPSVK